MRVSETTSDIPRTFRFGYPVGRHHTHSQPLMLRVDPNREAPAHPRQPEVTHASAGPDWLAA
jgi:hypothetical protein